MLHQKCLRGFIKKIKDKRVEQKMQTPKEKKKFLSVWFNLGMRRAIDSFLKKLT